jgi:hypothetical protein
VAGTDLVAEQSDPEDQAVFEWLKARDEQRKVENAQARATYPEGKEPQLDVRGRARPPRVYVAARLEPTSPAAAGPPEARSPQRSSAPSAANLPGPVPTRGAK